MKAKRNIRISLSLEELGYLEHIMWHFTDYMGGDDRSDHGMGILKGYREMKDQDRRTRIMVLSGRLRRLYRKKRLEAYARQRNADQHDN